MGVEIIKNLILNISFLIIVAQILTRSRLIKNLLYEKSSGNQKLEKQIGLGLLFGLISVISTHMGVEVSGSIVNMRVTGVLASGIIGGPLVAMITAVIAGTHRYFFALGSLTALSCGISTILDGLISMLAYLYLRENRWKKENLFLIGLFAGVMQMGMILLLAKPYEEAVFVVRMIAFPMSLFNAVGLVMFVSTFNSILVDRDNAVAEGMRLVMEISDQCLGYFRKGIEKRENMKQVARILISKTDFSAAAIYDKDGLIVFESTLPAQLKIENKNHPIIVEWILSHKKSRMMVTTKREDPLYEELKNHTVLGAPLKHGDDVIGVLLAFVPKHKFSYQTDVDFMDGIAKIFSTQLELAEAEKQKQLRHKAEFQALQAQINPHFLFNALNTITVFCREKPDRARELLITLSTYFRNTLNTKDYMIDIYEEIEHIKAYLELEKARFEERLQVSLQVADQVSCQVPCFILQPIVENAVKHGAMKRERGTVDLLLRQKGKEVIIVIGDNGLGISDRVLKDLYDGVMEGNKVGLANVHKRLISIYGEKYGLDIKSTEKGTKVQIKIPLHNRG